MPTTNHTGLVPDVITTTLEELLLGEWPTPTTLPGQQEVQLTFAAPWKGRLVETRQFVSVQALQDVPEMKRHIGRQVVQSMAEFIRKQG